MPLFTKESLETLRQRVDLADVISTHVELKRGGSAYKGLCPFHDEKSPSFTINKGDSHYHCYGCGAHGDAIQFLMEHLHVGFSDAVENLAQRFNVVLEIAEERHEPTGPRKADLKAALDQATQLYHFLLLHTEEGHAALRYLGGRGISLEFIKQFEIGLAPRTGGVLRKALHAKSISDALMQAAGLLATREDGSMREFFTDRITFPVRDATGAVVGFSARKYREETYGGKYINTTETPLFKKSRILFGLSYCRRRIAKEQRAIIVEGQLDALSLIYAGLNLAVAGLGTAFGEGHVAELIQLGVKRVYLALDADRAGQEAARKIGNLFQKEGIEVLVVRLPPGDDPDSVIRNEGIEAFVQRLEASVDYLAFLVEFHSKARDVSSATAKTQLVQEIATQVRSWDKPLLVHESLRKLAQIMQVPEDMVGVGHDLPSRYLIRRSASAGLLDIDPDRILEADLLRWVLLGGEQRYTYFAFVAAHLNPQQLRVEACRRLFEALTQAAGVFDLLTLATQAGHPDCQQLLAELAQKRIDKERGREHLQNTVQRLLDRNWMEQCEVIRMKIQSGTCSDDQAMALLKDLDQLKRNPPKVSWENVANGKPTPAPAVL